MSGIGSNNGWLEAAIAWEVCASLHRQYCKGKDALFTTRQADFVKYAENARAAIASHGQAPAGATPACWIPPEREGEYHSSLTITAYREPMAGWEPLYRVSTAQAAPAYKDSTPELHIGDSAFESWYNSYSPAHKSDKQRASDAYAAGMGEPLVTAAPAAVVVEPSNTVAYLDIGEGGYMDLGTDLADEALSRLPKGRHALVIAGTYGIDGYTAAPTAHPAPQQEAQEPVAGQCRFPGAVWSECSPEHVRMVLATPEEWKRYEVRYLYTAPQPSPVAQGCALDVVLDAFENKTRGIPQAHIAAALVAELRAAIEAASTTPTAQVDALDAARWRWLSEHIQVAWNEGKFTSLVRIVSEQHRQSLSASVDRMMAMLVEIAASLSMAAQEGKKP